ncbi:hypothetical protein DEO72_LG11g1245 [Vigna unguiculata]|uniref:Uncharacterized protein n=1 Tax=Vigna unguiculata TaxID=3917 RepID=A0A4D6NKT5_VIGUN|nr:hypothetical protein DEO72_LG11g1245 [Vigna unguiculata]
MQTLCLSALASTAVLRSSCFPSFGKRTCSASPGTFPTANEETFSVRKLRQRFFRQQEPFESKSMNASTVECQSILNTAD